MLDLYAIQVSFKVLLLIFSQILNIYVFIINNYLLNTIKRGDITYPKKYNLNKHNRITFNYKPLNFKKLIRLKIKGQKGCIIISYKLKLNILQTYS